MATRMNCNVQPSSLLTKYGHTNYMRNTCIPVYLVDEFSTQLCKHHRQSLFVFGDNALHRGKGGQAIIRDCENAVGFITKYKPTWESDAFLTDTGITRLEAWITGFDATIFTLLVTQDYTGIVLPKDGVGTGRAKLAQSSPLCFSRIQEYFQSTFGRTLTEKGFL